MAMPEDDIKNIYGGIKNIINSIKENYINVSTCDTKVEELSSVNENYVKIAFDEYSSIGMCPLPIFYSECSHNV